MVVAGTMPIKIDTKMRPEIGLLRPEAVSVMMPQTYTGTDGNKRVADVDTVLTGKYSVQSLFGNAPTILETGGQRVVATDQIIGPPDAAFQIGRIVTRTSTGHKFRVQHIRYFTDSIRVLVNDEVPP